MTVPVNILHLHSSFNLGGKEARAVRLMNAFGKRARHTIVSAEPDALGARKAIAPGVSVDFPVQAPTLKGRPSARRYEEIARFMRGFDLVLTYNWGALDAVMARRIFARSMRTLPPLVHHEDGFNADEARSLKFERNMFRKIALPAAAALIVPSIKLEKIALSIWKQPDDRLLRIPNGVPVHVYRQRPKPNAIPGFRRQKDELIVGSIAGLRPVKNLPRLVEAFASMEHSPYANMPKRLVIVGDGPERNAIMAAAERHRVADKLVMPGFVPNPQNYIGLFDIFALSSYSEQAPLVVLEAMAAGLPVVSTDVGDVGDMVAPENWNYVTDYLDRALTVLADHPHMRTQAGKANQARVKELFDEKDMIETYAMLYGEAVGRSDWFLS